MTRTLTARWVLPAAGPPLQGGLVAIRDDKIEAVEPHGTRAADDDLGNVAIIPGLVNPHTHLDLSGARGLIPPTDPDHFTDWLKGVIAYRKTRLPEQVQQDIRTGLAECLKFGTTLIGDITSGGVSWEAVSTSAVRGELFWEIIGLTTERYDAAQQQCAALAGHEWDEPPTAPCPSTATVHWSLSPHAPYSANHDRSLSQLCLGFCSMHLAESQGEIELLRTKSGPFVSFLEELGLWDPKLISATVEDFLVASKQSRGRRILVHCNYLPPTAPVGPLHSICYCPRTHAAFGHPPHPFREFLKRGVRVCLGTDSLASNPDLDILAEARFVHAKYPDFPGDRLLKMVTLAGAEALGWADVCGSLEPGKSADLVAVPLADRDGDPYTLLFSGEIKDTLRQTMFRGTWRPG
jgi:cytosine/adenosine deaminase-related metal-dependent hydrolase